MKEINDFFASVLTGYSYVFITGKLAILIDMTI